MAWSVRELRDELSAMMENGLSPDTDVTVLVKGEAEAMPIEQAQFDTEANEFMLVVEA